MVTPDLSALQVYMALPWWRVLYDASRSCEEPQVSCWTLLQTLSIPPLPKTNSAFFSLLFSISMVWGVKQTDDEKTASQRNITAQLIVKIYQFAPGDNGGAGGLLPDGPDVFGGHAGLEYEETCQGHRLIPHLQKILHFAGPLSYFSKNQTTSSFHGSWFRLYSTAVHWTSSSPSRMSRRGLFSRRMILVSATER